MIDNDAPTIRRTNQSRKKQMSKSAVAACLSLLLSLCGMARAESIVDTAFVQAAQARGAILWDVRAEADYAKGHIPGAVNIGAAGDVLRDPNTEDYIPQEQIERLLGTAGIDPAQEIIVYATQANAIAYFAAVTLRHFGGERVHVYHDGLEGWQAAGQPLSTEPARREALALKLSVDPSVMVSTDTVLAALEKPDVQILDVRTVGEYRGEDIRALRGGHIPGAHNIPYEQNWADPDARRNKTTDKGGLALKAPEALRALYADLDPSKETIVYCQSGVRASQTAEVLRDLGFQNVKVYDSSWLGYGNTLDAPADNVSFFNVGAMRRQVGELEQRLQTLEAARK